MKVLGIDPGISNTGYGLVIKESGRLSPGGFGSIETDSSADMSQRLDILYEGVRRIVEELTPDVVVLEQLFFNTNQKSVFAVGQARGVILLACRHMGVPWVEYTPLQVKKSVVGNGTASKEQVKYMVGALLKFAEPPRSLHACDALAMAICHINSSGIAARMGTGPR